MEEIEIELEDDEVESYLEGFKLPTVKKEEEKEGRPYRCGVCLEETSRLKDEARQHVEECHLARLAQLALRDTQQSGQEGRKECGACGEETWGETEMVNHWVSSCRELFNRQQSRSHTINL